jgi:hypothetical protein
MCLGNGGQPDEDIGFHYDKDEGIASEQMRMVYPHTSSITYLSNVGAPTFIMNMTTPDGWSLSWNFVANRKRGTLFADEREARFVHGTTRKKLGQRSSSVKCLHPIPRAFIQFHVSLSSSTPSETAADGASLHSRNLVHRCDKHAGVLS